MKDQMYDLVVIGNPTFHNGHLSGPSVFSATTAARLGIEHVAIISTVGSQVTDVFIQGVDGLDIPEYFIIEAKEKGVVQVQTPNLGQETSISCIPDKINIRDIPDEFLHTRAILLSPALQEITAEFIEWICNSTDALVYLDPQIRRLNSKGHLEIIRDFSVTEKTQSYLDIIKPNQLESELITGEADPFLAAELIVEWASEACIITLGKNGSLVYDGEDFSIIPSYPIEEVDSMGAGAVYLAAFAIKAIDSNPLIDCGAYASSVASIKVEHKWMDFFFQKTEINSRTTEIQRLIETR